MRSFQIWTLVALAIGWALYRLRCRQEAKLLDKAKPVQFIGWGSACLMFLMDLASPIKRMDGMPFGFACGYILFLTGQYFRRIRELRHERGETVIQA